jgi:hypothetical protein
MFRWLCLALCACLAACGEGDFALPGNRVYPSGVDYSHRHKVFYVGSHHDGSIQTVDWRGRSALFRPGGREQALRVKVDDARGRLWMLDYEALYLYSLPEGRLIHRVAASGPLAAPLADMALDREGNAYVGSGMRGLVYRVDVERLALEPWLKLDTLAGPSALAVAVSPDGQRLVLAESRSGRFWKVEVRTRKPERLELSEPLSHVASLIWDEAARGNGPVLYAALGNANSISRIELDSGFKYGSVRRFTRGALEGPFALTLAEGALYAAASQLAHHPDYGGDGRPLLPFRLVRINGAPQGALHKDLRERERNAMVVDARSDMLKNTAARDQPAK